MGIVKCWIGASRLKWSALVALRYLANWRRGSSVASSLMAAALGAAFAGFSNVVAFGGIRMIWVNGWLTGQQLIWGGVPEGQPHGRTRP